MACDFCGGCCSCHICAPCGHCETHTQCAICGKTVCEDIAIEVENQSDGDKILICPDCDEESE